MGSLRRLAKELLKKKVYWNDLNSSFENSQSPPHPFYEESVPVPDAVKTEGKFDEREKQDKDEDADCGGGRGESERSRTDQNLVLGQESTCTNIAQDSSSRSSSLTLTPTPKDCNIKTKTNPDLESDTNQVHQKDKEDLQITKVSFIFT